MFGFPMLTAISKLRKMLALFRKEKALFFLLNDITGTVTDGLRKEVQTSIDAKTNVLVREIRKSVIR